MNMTLIVAPGENSKPKSILTDDHCEELAHPYLFATGKFGYKVSMEVKLSATKYFNQRLHNYTQKLASDLDYNFYALAVTQVLNLNSQISVAMKKVTSNRLTGGMLSSNYAETVKSYLVKNDCYTFMSPIKGTPAYWKRFLFELFAMVKHLGLPTYFMTLSCADLIGMN